MTGRGSHLHVVTDDEARLLDGRARARARFILNYDTPEARRTMLGALDRVARSYSNGELNGSQFPWEALCDEDLAAEVWRATSIRYEKATAQRDASAIRMMLKALWKEGLLTFEQYQLAVSFRTKGADPSPLAGRTLTDSEITRLVEYDPPGKSQNIRIRDRALVYLLASTGARRREIGHVLTEHMDLENQAVRLVATKNGHPRDAWLHPSAVSGIQRWMEVRGSDPGPLLLALSRTGRPLPGRALSPFQMWKVIRGRSEECGIGPVTPHDLRRFVVTRLLEEGHDLLLVSRLVGHSNPAVTALYDRRPAEACRRAVETLPLPAA